MIRGICLGTISIDCKDAANLRNFYAELLGWESCEMYDCPALRGQNGLALLFMPADFEYEKPVWPEEPNAQQKQMHFDFQVDDLLLAVSQAEALGALKSETQF